MSGLHILFLGARKRVSLLECFADAGSRLNIDLRLFSCEKEDGFCPISSMATILPGPSFASDEFQSWLKSVIDSRSIDIIIPNVDPATVPLSRFSESYTGKCWPVISASNLCETMYDKKLANDFFSRYAIPIAPDTLGRYPKIARPRWGSAGKGIRLIRCEEEHSRLLAGDDTAYVIQDLIANFQETSVDLYLSPRYGLIGYVLRDRIKVEAGEVMECRTRTPRECERALIEKIAAIRGWQGCVTLQYLADQHGDLHVLEINPRFGGGATCGIAAGLDMPGYILSEYLDRPVLKPDDIRRLVMTRARRDFFCDY